METVPIKKRNSNVNHDKMVKKKSAKLLTNKSTVSIAVPSSVMNNAKSQILKTQLADQIARAAAIFCITEIIVYSDYPKELDSEKQNSLDNDSIMQLAQILQFLECPQYLRKQLFPLHKFLTYAGILNPLQLPHHYKKNEKVKFREGVVVNKKSSNKNGSYVDVGLQDYVHVDKELFPGIRVTVEMDKYKTPYTGKIISPSYPYQFYNIYWGYSVRIANDLTAVLKECPYSDNYDLIIGTSDRGDNLDIIEHFPKYLHLLIIFGGPHGIEYAAENSNKIYGNPINSFHYYLNTCPNQGTKTIRTEEAILITLSALRNKLSFSKNYYESDRLQCD